MKLKNYWIRFLLVAIFFFAMYLSSKGQEVIKSELDDYMHRVATEAGGSKTPEILMKNEHPEEMLNFLIDYTEDSSASVRKESYYIMHKIAKNYPEITKPVLVNLVKGIDDEESFMAGVIVRYLRHYKKSDFPTEAKDTLSAMLERETYNYKNVVKIAGFVEPNNAERILKNKIRHETYPNASFKLVMYFALCRMGDEEGLSFCINLLEQAPVNDKFIYNVAPDFIYTRQKSIIDYFIEIVNSDEKNCTSPNPELDREISCGYRVLELLAPVIKDFPLKVDSFGELKTDNYREALKTARAWFAEHKDDYLLKKNIY
ncbi:MAG: hypothetical protein ACLFT4_00365 [Bacteroidales bacterium]